MAIGNNKGPTGHYLSTTEIYARHAALSSLSANPDFFGTALRAHYGSSREEMWTQPFVVDVRGINPGISGRCSSIKLPDAYSLQIPRGIAIHDQYDGKVFAYRLFAVKVEERTQQETKRAGPFGLLSRTVARERLVTLARPVGLAELITGCTDNGPVYVVAAEIKSSNPDADPSNRGNRLNYHVFASQKGFEQLKSQVSGNPAMMWELARAQFPALVSVFVPRKPTLEFVAAGFENPMPSAYPDV